MNLTILTSKDLSTEFIYSTLLGHPQVARVDGKEVFGSESWLQKWHPCWGVWGFSAPSGGIILIYKLQGIVTNQPPGTWSSFEILELDTAWLCTSKFATHIWPLMMHDATAWFFFAFVGSMMGTKHGDRQRVVVMTISWLWLACNKIWMYYDTPMIWYCCWIMIMYHIRLLTNS